VLIVGVCVFFDDLAPAELNVIPSQLTFFCCHLLYIMFLCFPAGYVLCGNFEYYVIITLIVVFCFED